MTKQLQQQANEMCQAKSRKRYARNLAEALMSKAHIPDGRHLIAILGTGLEFSNVEALATWIEQMLPLIGSETLNAHECLELLEKCLETTLIG